MDMSIRVQTASEGPTGTTTMITEYASLTTEVEVTTQRYDNPGKMTFTCIEKGSAKIDVGSSVSFTVGGVPIFKGYVFTAEHNRDGEISYTAYDQLRYLKANASYVFEAMTLGQIIEQIAADFGLVCGTLEDTGYAFPCLIKENESCLNIIFDALSETIYRSGRLFNFYDDNGALTLREAKNMYVNTIIGDGSLLTDYTYKRDIDSDTYNRVKLVRPNSETGRADTYIAEDTDTQAKWGLLQYYDQVDENMNEAQIEELCQTYLSYYNRVLQTVTIEAMGVKEIRAGAIVPVKIGAIKDLEISRLLLTEKVTHKFESDIHTMSIEVKDFQQLGGMSIV